MQRSLSMNNLTQSSTTSRRGSTLIIVLALLGLLTMLGFVFFSFATMERQNAENYSEGLKASPDLPDDGFEFGLKSVLVGPSQDRYNSSLHSGYHSVVRNLAGTDSRPLSGEGITATDAAAGVNLSRSARANGQAVDESLLPNADVDYDYPDHNNMFLAYIGKTVRLNSFGIPELVDVIIPSYFRPSMMQSTTGVRPLSLDWHGGSSTSGDTTPTATQTFRPHPDHLYITRNGRPVSNSGVLVRRFLDDNNPADAAAIASLIGASGGFPFAPPDNALGDPVIQGEMGIWTSPTAAVGTNSPLTIYELDVDNDGDGTPDSIWQDFDYSLLEDPTNGAQYTLLHSVLVLDLDSLVNLNTSGNLAGLEKNSATFGDAALQLGGVYPTAAVPAGLANRTKSVSESNLGLTPSEINPTWAMLRPYPTTAYDWSVHHTPAFNRAPFEKFEAANMALFWLLTGRGVYDTNGLDDLHVGRHGEPDRLLFALNNLTGSNPLVNFPRPGIFDADDDGNVLEGAFGFGLRAYGQPLDFDGSGRYTMLSDPRVAMYRLNRDKNDAITAYAQNGPIRWMQYNGYSLFDQGGSATAANAHQNLLANPYVFGRDDDGERLAHPNALMEYDTANAVTTARVNTLFDHESEVIVEPERAVRPFDEIFDAKDVLEFFLDPADAAAAIDTVSDRVSSLLPYTFGDTGDISIRKRFTTLSWRYRLLSLASALGPNGVYDNGTGDDGIRAWEFNADTSLFDTNNDGVMDPNGKDEFPPQFGTSPNVVLPFVFGTQTLDAANNLNEDPFRPPVRRTLRTEIGDQKAEFGQRPLSTNQLTTVERLPNRTADLVRGVLESRPLTEHPLITDAATQAEIGAMLTTWSIKGGNNNLPLFPPQEGPGAAYTETESREFWARRDRQQMARDIYVLLYTLCGGQDGTPTTGSNMTVNVSTPTYTTPIYTPEQLQQMAQFAVNLVDALDRDDVITKFEYDRNLGTTTLNSGSGSATYSGWNLDDNPDTSNDLTVPASLSPIANDADGNPIDINNYERGVVYGVERQQIAFSEVLGIVSRGTTSDHASTPWDDDVTNGHRLHLFMELQNMLPRSVDLYTGDATAAAPTNGNNAVWRIRRVENAGRAVPAADRTLEFLPNSANVIAPGNLFSIGSNYQGDTATHSTLGYSDYYVDTDLDTPVAFECIAPLSSANLPLTTDLPAAPSTNTAYNPRTNLDLAHDRHRINVTRFTVDRGVAPDPGAFLDTIDTTDGVLDPANGPEFDLVLERRANLNMPSLPAGNNSITTDVRTAEGLNDWVVVDRITVDTTTFDLMDADGQTEVIAKLSSDVRSFYRREILARGSEGPTTTVPNTAYPYSLNSIRAGAGDADSGWHPTATGANAVQNLHQIHFDRDFASIGELLDLPLFGPESLTALLDESRQTAPAQVLSAESSLPNITARAWTATNAPVAGQWPQSDDAEIFNTPLSQRPTGYGLVAGAIGKLLAPEPTAATSRIAGLSDNRWYRLLGFIEVPTRMHRQLGNPMQLERVPGAINLNMLRHPEVLAALIDDAQIADMGLDETVGGVGGIMPGGLTDVTPGGNADSRANSNPPGETRPKEDWFWQLVRSRDGQFTTGGQTVYLPGWTGGTQPALPFRSLTRLTTAASKATDLQDTILRADPQDSTAGAADARRLFEVGTVADHTSLTMANGTANQQLSNPMLRHRVLSKIMNNSTTGSNAFVIFMTIGHFEATEDTNGAIRIGGEYDINGDGMVDDLDRKRAAFVVDRSEAFEAYDPGTGTFDWRRLVKHRVDIQ